MTNATDALAIKAARVKGWQPFEYEATDNGYMIVRGSVPFRISKTGNPVWATGADRKMFGAPMFYKVIVLSNARIEALEKQMKAEAAAPTPTPEPVPKVPAPEVPKQEPPERPTFDSFRARG